MNTGTGSLSLLQWILPRQESNRALMPPGWATPEPGPVVCILPSPSGIPTHTVWGSPLLDTWTLRTLHWVSAALTAATLHWRLPSDARSFSTGETPWMAGRCLKRFGVFPLKASTAYTEPSQKLCQTCSTQPATEKSFPYSPKDFPAHLFPHAWYSRTFCPS